jgi:excisionase family DNA binding protein
MPNPAKKSTNPNVEPTHVAPGEAAARLSCSTQTITKLIRQGRLRATYLSRSAVRIAVADLEKILQPYDPRAPRGRRKKAGLQ